MVLLLLEEEQCLSSLKPLWQWCSIYDDVALSFVAFYGGAYGALNESRGQASPHPHAWITKSLRVGDF